MKKILFVDDEPYLLSGLKRLLRSMRNEWEMTFIERSERALEILDTHSYDLIVSDAKMPGMDGNELLTEVSKRHPEMARLVLSGHADLELNLEYSTIIHQLLSKPCDPELLKSTIKHVIDVRDILVDKSLRSLVGRIETLPSQLTVYLEIVEALESLNTSEESVVAIIEKDIGMTAKILQLANSPLVSFNKVIISISHAVQILGIDLIRSLVLAYGIFSQAEQLKDIPFKKMEAFYKDSLQCRLFAEYICASIEKNPEMIACSSATGMLHDVGILILRTYMPDEYEAVDIKIENKSSLDWKEEQKVFGVSHSEIGAYLLGLWGLPDDIVDGVHFHNDPEKHAGPASSPKLSVHIASTLLRDGDESDLNLDYLEELGLLQYLPDWQKKCEEISNL